MKKSVYAPEGLLVNDGHMTTTRITATYLCDEYGRSSISLADNVRKISIIVSAEPFFMWLKGCINSKFGYEVNNLLKQDNRKEQEDEKQEDAGE